MSGINISKVETPKRSKSMTLLPPPEINTLSIKQIGDYSLGEEVGCGAFGKVVLGKHILTEEKVAIKILDKMILNQTPEDYELVNQEISILKLVKHKFIVQLYEILQTAQHIFIIMEYCEGKEILDYILTKNRLSELESLKYFQQLINCLFYLHSQNIAHRDIKIDNMLLDSNKDLKLIDFGLSTKYTDDNLLDQPCGTVVYAAPEVLEGKEYHGMLADVWSSGIVLYGMLSGFLPFSDKDDEINKKQVIKGEIKYPDFFSDMAIDLLKHMLDIDPMTRYTLQEIKDHPWFNMTECILIPGIIIDYNIVPVDDKILNLCVTYNKEKNEVFNSVRNNKFDSNSALYYLLIKKLKRKGFKSISDLCSDEFIEYILDEKNLVNQGQINDNNIEINDAISNVNEKNNDKNEEEEEEILFENMNKNNIEEKEQISEKEILFKNNEKENNEEKGEISLEKINQENNDIKEENKEKIIDKEEVNINEIINDKNVSIDKVEESDKNVISKLKKDKDVLIEKKKDEEYNNNKGKLSEILNSSFSQKSNTKESNKELNNNNNNDNNNSKEKLIEQLEINNVNNNNGNSDKQKIYYSDNNTLNNKDETNSINEKILSTPEKLEKEENKILEAKRRIIEEGEKKVLEKIIDEKEVENEKHKDFDNKNKFEEIIVEEHINNIENKNLDIQNINNNKEHYKKEDNSKIENIGINVGNQNKNYQKKNEFIEDKIKITFDKGNENTQNIKVSNNINLINTEIDLTNKNNNIKNNLQINIANNNIINHNHKKKELKKFENTINNIEVVDIKINKNEKLINIKNERRFNKTTEKKNKSKLSKNKKNINENKLKYIFKTQKKKLFSIEKSNNILTNLKKSQLKPLNKKKIFSGTEIKNNKNRSVFKIKYSQNINYKRDNSLENENQKKNLSKIANYSTRNTKKKLIFTNSKPSLEFNKNIINKKNHTNLKKKTSNKIFNIIKIINNNNFSTTVDFNLKNFIHSSSQNYHALNINKTNLQSRFDDAADKNKEKIEETLYYGINNNNNSIHFKMYNNLSLTKKKSNPKYLYKRNKSIINKNNISNKYNNFKKNEKIYNNYTSLLSQHKKEYNNMNSNIIKSIIRLDYEDKKRKMKNSLNGKQHSLSSQKNFNKSISHNFYKKNNYIIKPHIITITEENKMNKNNTRPMESSVIVNRYKSPIIIRDLSESPKQRYLNIKTRYSRIPWKIKKKGIDENKEINIVYNQYLKRLANPFNQNNSKIVNYEKISKNNNLLKNSYNFNSNQKLNKTLWTTNIKQIKIGKYNDFKNYNKKQKSQNKFNYNNENTSRNKKKISKEKLTSKNLQKNIEQENNKININTKDNNEDDYNKAITLNKKNFNSMSNSNLKISNINSLSTMKTYLSNENKNKIILNNKKDSENQNINDNINLDNTKIHNKNNYSESSSLTFNLKNKFNINDYNNEIFNPMDLSCLFIKYKNQNEYINNLKNKLKKNCINYIQKKSNVFICNKNGYNCKIEIVKMNDDYNTKNVNNSNDNNGNIFYLKIYGKKEGYGINDIFKKFILNFN